ncbi:MAG: SdrD B-like domain-containing protein, partial [Pseudomonadota bacterium]
TVLGKVPSFEPRETADPWISLNAVTILTGTHASEDEQGRVVLTLDERLLPQFGLELWVNGVPIDTFENEPRTIGPILLVPLRPIVEELGHELSVENGVVIVRRQQDQATIRLELATGLVSVNTTPRGVAPNIQLADREELILPFGAVESLTGTHIKLVPRTNRVEVTLDNRLTSAVLPGADISEEAKNTPLTLEHLTYQVSDRGPVRVETVGHWSKYNFRTQVETAGGLENLAGKQPGWASVDIASMDGWTATVGDYTSDYRELNGVGANRMRGIAWRKQRDSGSVLALAAGTALVGSKEDSDSVAVPDFDGFVAGGRLISKDQTQDVGVSVGVSGDGAQSSAVLDGQKSFYFNNRDKGLQSAYVSGDLGVFSGDTSGVDVQARGSLNYAINQQLGLSASAGYEGEKFASGGNRASFEGVFDQRNGARTNLSVGTTWRAKQKIGPLHRVTVSGRGTLRHEGGEESKTATTLSASVNAQVGERGPSVSAIVQTSTTEVSGASQKADSVRLRAVQRFDYGSVSAAYSYTTDQDGEKNQQFVATAQVNPYKRTFENGASVQVVPNMALNWDGEQTRINAGASVVADSGAALGPRLNVRSRLSSFSSYASESETAQTTGMLGSMEARYALTRNAELTAIYTDDFRGRSDLSVGVRGLVRFNPPRVSRIPDDGRGVLNGRVFLDRNRDGIRQDNEPGVPGVRVKVIGTRMGLNTTGEGYFTIQNIPQGLYALTVSRKSLPLGYLVPEDAQPRVTVGAGRRSDVEIPLILSGQVRGTVFIDDNANGEVDSGEERLEGQWISLVPKDGSEPINVHSAAFGQYGFESIMPGEYTARTTVAGQPVNVDIVVDPKNPFVVAAIPIPPDLGESGAGLDFSSGVLGEP